MAKQIVETTSGTRKLFESRVFKIVGLVVVGSLLITVWGAMSQLTLEQILLKEIEAIGFGLIVASVLTILDKD